MTTHIREHRSLLAATEKRLLVWIAARLPRWVTSDHLTWLGLASMLGAGLAFASARWTLWTLPLVPVFLALNWFGDSLDGTLARVRREERPRYGYYLDHVLDLIGACGLSAGLAVSSFMNPFLAVGVLVAYLLVSAEVFLATCAQGVFRLAVFGVGPTELRLVLAIGALALMHDPHVPVGRFGTFRLFDVGGGVAIAGLTMALATAAVRNARALARADARPRRTAAELTP